MHFGVLDLDKLTEAQFSEVSKAASDYDFILYTTWSHSERFKAKGTWSFRLVARFSRPVLASEWRKFWPRFNAIFAGYSDQKCKDASRLYFIPSAPADGDGESIHNPGRPVDVDALLAAPVPEAKAESLINKADLLELAARLKSKRSPEAKAVSAYISEGVEGVAFAPQGDRDNTLFILARYLAKEWPHAAPEHIASFFKEAVEKQEGTDGPGLEVFTDKIGRKQNELEDTKKELEELAQDKRILRISEAFKGTRNTPYTPEELARYASEAGVAAPQFMALWILQAGKSYYFFKGGEYGKAYMDSEALRVAQSELAAASTAGVDLTKVSEKGNISKKKLSELVDEYGSVLDFIIVDLHAQKSSYDWNTKTLTEAPTPIRDIEPKENPQVAKWLELLGGENPGKLLDWVAVVTDLSEPCASLYLGGAPGTGKTLLADALSRLWSEEGPVDMADAVENFNDASLKCPLVLADEVLPEAFRKQSATTGDLRNFIQARGRSLKRKFLPMATLKGATRLILTANNEDLLRTSESLTENDIAAISDRILSIEPSEKAAVYLLSLPPEVLQSWGAGDTVAAHALWLKQTRTVKRGKRFLVSGDSSSLSTNLTIQTYFNSIALRWLVSYLQNPKKVDNTGAGLIKIIDGGLYVNTRALSEYWEVYETGEKVPAHHKINTAISSLSHKERRGFKDGRGKLQMFRKVKTEYLVAWAEKNLFDIEENIVAALQKETQPKTRGTVVPIRG
ncbi:MAG: hypothetical protein JRD89_01540 [Deltaproteobacteria bacterium]|nr:hypothetical protein [Deltaproteobacteria bacterium]